MGEKFMNELTLHHCSKRIAPGSLDFVMDLFGQLGCKESYREDGAAWAMVEQDDRFIIQLIETDQKPEATEKKSNSHIAFLSDDPKADIDEIGEWVEDRGFAFIDGQWSGRERYFDCPEVFVDFVVEIMDRSVIEN